MRSKLRVMQRAGWLVVGLVAVAAPAAAWKLDPQASRDALRAFHRQYSTAMYAFPRHGASPLGLAGWDISGSVGYLSGFDQEESANEAIDGSLQLDTLVPIGLGVRKGLPWNIDLGLFWSRDLEGGPDRWAGEVQWAFFEGGAATPAVALRLTAGQGSDNRYRLRQAGAELLISKGFAVLTPFAGVGLVYSESTFTRASLPELSVDSTDPIFYAGATLNLLLPKITVSVEKGEELLWVAQIGFGF